ncbi:MAG: hypothetical protein D6693_01900, partial [Planctomycetota bacterium]
MPKRLSPAAVVALKEAIGKIYWFKSDLRSFLYQSVKDAGVLGGVNWDTYKWQIASDVVDRLCGDEVHVATLMRLCREVCDMTSFKHLERLDGGEEKAKRARDAVAHLRSLVETHESAEEEQDAAIQRQRRESERLAQSGAVRQKLGEIRERYMNFVVSEDAQGRGFELERIMYDIFELFDLDPKASFRIVGEQIDGAFSLEGTDYLFEAKWQKAPCGASDLDAFAAKVQRRLDNTLGVFLSINGCSEDGLIAHQRTRAMILLMDGAHLMGVLE